MHYSDKLAVDLMSAEIKSTEVTSNTNFSIGVRLDIGALA